MGYYSSIIVIDIIGNGDIPISFGITTVIPSGTKGIETDGAMIVSPSNSG